MPIAHLSQKHRIVSVCLLITLFFYPLATFTAVYAEDSVPPATEEVTTETTTPPEETASAEEPTGPATGPTDTPGPTRPTGADGTTYVQNPETGMWENDHYIWDPVTKQTKPKVAPNYSYNPTTGKWDTTEWRYNAVTGKYEQNVVSTPTPPANANVDQPEFTDEAAELRALANLTGPDSTNGIDATAHNNFLYDQYFNAVISNQLYSYSASGDASVMMNTQGGNALSGDALSMANVINLLQSSWGLDQASFNTFMANIDGDVFGDLTIDPSQLAGQLNVANSQTNNLTINTDTNGVIDNDIELIAGSGDATVSRNTSAGDATTGSAQAVANIVNLINSSIATGQSFLGAININGNLVGDILFPPEVLNQLLASNGPNSNLNSTNIENTSILAEFNNEHHIQNDVDLTANSGSATVDNNTSAGNATTGNASTNLTVLNLTGRNVIGSNSLLVFVNVLGKWVGMIVDAPGSTAAALGGGITTSNILANNVSIEENNTSLIHNDIDLSATTGDATVSQNTNAGNATTGDASASANMVNISGSNLSLSDWFGILFINVFGTWQGSFGVDTEAGDTPAVASSNTSGTPPPQVFRFEPSTSNRARLARVTTPVNDSTVNEQIHAALASFTAPKTDTKAFNPTKEVFSSTQSSPNGFLLPAMGLTISAGLLGAERLVSARQRRKQE